MTVKELLTSSGLKFTQKDCSHIGNIVSDRAKASNIGIKKKPEIVDVNDYPEDFVVEMQNIAIEYFAKISAK